MRDRTRPWTALDKVCGAALLGAALVAGAALALQGWRAAWPVDLWYVLNAVRVDDAREGEPVIIMPDRQILRDFSGRYVTTVRSVPDMRPICSGGSSVPYRASSTLPDPVTLDWWTAGALPPCMEHLKPGHYVLTSCIHVDSEVPLVGVVSSCVDSNIFKVKP